MHKLRPLAAFSSIVLICLLFSLIVSVSEIAHSEVSWPPPECGPARAQRHPPAAEPPPLPPAKLRAWVARWNERGVLGSRALGAPVIAVHVHRDLPRLRCLVASLAQVTDIGGALLVFSHSYYDENINDLIQGIDFSPVSQIFYPGAAQLHSGAVRTTRAAEAKHHWWWTARFVFDRLARAGATGDTVAFVEEDSYVLPDLLFMLRKSTSALAAVPDASVLALGRSPAVDLEHDKLIVEAWRPAYDRGLAFNGSTWRRIAALGAFYCRAGDPGWSHSLLRVFERFPGGRALMLASEAPRVLRAGGGGSQRGALFPRRVRAVQFHGPLGRETRAERPPRVPAAPAPRERALCERARRAPLPPPGHHEGFPSKHHVGNVAE